MNIAINYWAVLVAALANMVVGSLWYGPLFGKLWMKLAGLTKESIKSMGLTMAQAMTGGLATSLLMAYVLAHFAGRWAAMGAAGAWQLAFWIWLGFVATTQAGSFLWEAKPFKLFILNAANSLVSLFAMALILVLWK